jgi:hypothetical protein
VLGAGEEATAVAVREALAVCAAVAVAFAGEAESLDGVVASEQLVAATAATSATTGTLLDATRAQKGQSTARFSSSDTT